PVRVLDGAAVGTRAVVGAARPVRALLAGRRIVLVHLPNDLQVRIFRVALVAQEQRLLPVRNHDPDIVRQLRHRRTPYWFIRETCTSLTRFRPDVGHAGRKPFPAAALARTAVPPRNRARAAGAF